VKIIGKYQYIHRYYNRKMEVFGQSLHFLCDTKYPLYLQFEHKWSSVNKECIPCMVAKGFRLCNGENDSPAPSSKILCYCELLGS
jgi:hypothetical protein